MNTSSLKFFAPVVRRQPGEGAGYVLPAEFELDQWLAIPRAAVLNVIEEVHLISL